MIHRLFFISITLILLLDSATSSAQCFGDCYLTLNIDGFCIEDQTTLRANTNSDSLIWDYDGSNNITFSIKPTVTTTISVQATGFGPSLIKNGDFDQLNLGFETDYSITPLGDKFENGEYNITANPSAFTSAFLATQDHTGNNGNMMIVDASTDSSLAFYRTWFKVTKDSMYTVNAWFSNIHFSFDSLKEGETRSAAFIGLYLNDELTDSLQLPQDTEWHKINLDWIASTEDSVELAFKSINTSLKENDFAFDDLSVRQHVKLKRSIEVIPCNEENVFSPNGDGYMDRFYINETGEAQIYDLDGILVKTIQSPAFWDGSDSNGQPAKTGYYAIVVNKETIVRVSLMK